MSLWGEEEPIDVGDTEVSGTLKPVVEALKWAGIAILMGFVSETGLVVCE